MARAYVIERKVAYGSIGGVRELPSSKMDFLTGL